MHKETFTKYDAQQVIDCKGKLDEEIKRLSELNEHFISAHPEAIVELLKELKYHREKNQ